jgi:NAD(P)-dependent dehydrogenase (short-subunit alcohol dehydrogenase family)
MKVVVITGSTRGIGYGLADSFLSLGCSVVVSGRTTSSVGRASGSLAARHGTDPVFGRACDVTQVDQVQALWDAAKTRFGVVDIWINNAGVPSPRLDFRACSTQQIDTVVATNLLGTMYGAKVALCGMLEQGFGELYNVEGLGSDGRRVRRTALYGTTKRAVRYLTESLVAEMEGTPVRVGALSPGMVVTDFLLQGRDPDAQEWQRTKRVLNILADRVETVAPWLARRVLENEAHGARIAWLTRGKILWRFLTAPFRRRDLFA